jgi:hypothetical protein
MSISHQFWITSTPNNYSMFERNIQSHGLTHTVCRYIWGYQHNDGVEVELTPFLYYSTYSCSTVHVAALYPPYCEYGVHRQNKEGPCWYWERSIHCKTRDTVVYVDKAGHTIKICIDNGMEYKYKYRYRYKHTQMYRCRCRTYVGNRERNGGIVPICGYYNITTTITKHPTVL